MKKHYEFYMKNAPIKWASDCVKINKENIGIQQTNNDIETLNEDIVVYNGTRDSDDERRPLIHLKEFKAFPVKPIVTDFEEWKNKEVKYRTQRKRAYIKELSDEGTFEDTAGNLLDAIIAAIMTFADSMQRGVPIDVGSLELHTMVTKIMEIKARFPKQ